MNRYVLSILVKDNSGVLRRVAGLFSRRGYNIESLTVGNTEEEGTSRITVVVAGDEYIVEQIRKQVSKLIEVIKISQLEAEESVYRELMLLKVKTTKATRGEIIEIVNIFRAKIIDVAPNSMIIEITGDSKKLQAIYGMLEPFTILEMNRTGLAALSRGEKLLKKD